MDSKSKREVVNFNPESGMYHVTYDYPTEPPSIAVPRALAELTDRGVTDLDPLYDASNVDPDALDEMFRPTARGDRRDVKVTFTYHDYEITVKHYGRIVLRPPET